MKLLKHAGVHVQSSIEIEGNGAIIQSVASGLGVSLVSEVSAREHLMTGRVAILSFPIEFHRPLYWAKLKDKPTTSAAKAFIDIATL